MYKITRSYFNDEIVFNIKKFLSQLEKDFRNLVTSPLLRGNQKLNILNQYVYPKLIYPLQITLADLLNKNFLERVDILVRRGVREIYGLPVDTPILVYYTGRKYRGLSMLRVIWETFIQQIAISQKLVYIQDPYLLVVRDLR